jgi:hypothetical protein
MRQEYLLKPKSVYESIDKPENLAIRVMFHVWICLAGLYHLRYRWNEAFRSWYQSLAILENLATDGQKVLTPE